MIDLHFICPQGRNLKPLGDMTFETGNWAVSDEKADEAVGGRVYLHEKQRDRSWHGGTILSWRPFNTTRKIFTYKAEGEIRVLCPGGWGQEQATVWRQRPRKASSPRPTQRQHLHTFAQPPLTNPRWCVSLHTTTRPTLRGRGKQMNGPVTVKRTRKCRSSIGAAKPVM